MLGFCPVYREQGQSRRIFDGDQPDGSQLGKFRESTVKSKTCFSLHMCLHCASANDSRSSGPCTLFPQPPSISTMASSQQPKERDGVLSALDVLIQALNLAKDSCGIPPAQIALGSAAVLLTMIRVRFLPILEDGLLTRVDARTRWPTIRISSTLDKRVVMYARYYTRN